jgi:hypothetical protein
MKMDIKDLGQRAAILQPTPQPQIHILSFAEGLAALKVAGVFTAQEVRSWVIYGKIPNEFPSDAYGQPFEDPSDEPAHETLLSQTCQ